MLCAQTGVSERECVSAGAALGEYWHSIRERGRRGRHSVVSPNSLVPKWDGASAVPAAEPIEYPPSVDKKPGAIALEELVDELARVNHESENARILVLRAGFPAGDLPTFDVPQVFWSRVIRAAASGKHVGGLQALVDEAAKQFPGNVVFASYRAQAGGPVGALNPGGSFDYDRKRVAATLRAASELVSKQRSSFGAISILASLTTILLAALFFKFSEEHDLPDFARSELPVSASEDVVFSSEDLCRRKATGDCMPVEVSGLKLSHRSIYVDSAVLKTKQCHDCKILAMNTDGETFDSTRVFLVSPEIATRASSDQDGKDSGTNLLVVAGAGLVGVGGWLGFFLQRRAAKEQQRRADLEMLAENLLVDLSYRGGYSIDDLLNANREDAGTLELFYEQVSEGPLGWPPSEAWQKAHNVLLSGKRIRLVMTRYVIQSDPRSGSE